MEGGLGVLGDESLGLGGGVEGGVEGFWALLVHCCFSIRSCWICWRRSSFSALEAARDSVWSSVIESVRLDGEEVDVAVVILGEGDFLASIRVPNEIKLLSSVCGDVSSFCWELGDGMPSNCMETSWPKSSSSMSSNSASSCDWN